MWLGLRHQAALVDQLDHFPLALMHDLKDDPASLGWGSCMNLLRFPPSCCPGELRCENRIEDSHNHFMTNANSITRVRSSAMIHREFCTMVRRGTDLPTTDEESPLTHGRGLTVLTL